MNSDIDVFTDIHCGSEEADFDRNPNVSTRTKRRVRFPNDDQLISDYLEPFSPVSANCSNEELLAAYLSSCCQHKVAPIDFLLEQLKGIDLSICNERYSRLSLKGIKLSRSHIETMEEIFQRVHFRELDLENTFLDDQSAVAFFDIILHYESCNDLRISLNMDRLSSSQAWQHCVTFMRKSNMLNSFTLSHTPLHITNFLGFNFFGLCLQRLTFNDCNLSGQTLFGLVGWLLMLLTAPSLNPGGRLDKSGHFTAHKLKVRSSSKSHNSKCVPVHGEQPQIWELKLALMNNRLVAADAEHLVHLFRHHLLIPKCSAQPNGESDSNNNELKTDDNYNARLPIGGIGYLSELDLSHNNLRDEGLGVLCTGLLQTYRTRLRNLHDDENTRVDAQSDSNKEVDDFPIFAEYNVNQKYSNLVVRGVERLSLCDNNLSSTGMHSIALILMQTPEPLVSILGGLISLDLSNNENIKDAGVEILCEGLIRNRSLKELYLRSVQITFSGIFSLSSFLSESKCLRLLDIRNNELDLASLMALSKTLTVNQTLTTFLSDARRIFTLTSHADDKELISSLIHTIDSCLRRNRTTSSPVPCSPDKPSVNMVTVDPVSKLDDYHSSRTDATEYADVIEVNHTISVNSATETITSTLNSGSVIANSLNCTSETENVVMNLDPSVSYHLTDETKEDRSFSKDLLTWNSDEIQSLPGVQ